ncbi:MAG TPA: response regulator transcription factor [Flavobacteriaceae bacterium]|nr:response regulator transcription factor [Flavobacteriaceae bacterium]
MKNKHIEILLVDDDPDILEILSYNLSKQGYQIRKAKNGKKALEKAKEKVPHLIILDLMMPGMDGIETCKKLRLLPDLQNTIITFLTAVNQDIKELESYDAGADDYITKPIRPKILVRKVKALLRRFNNQTDRVLLSSGDLTIDKQAYQIKQKGQKLHLPKKEFDILYLLVAQTGKVFSREEILNEVWGENVIVGGRTVDVHIRKLREKIGAEKIETVSGIGYKYVL